MLWKKIVSDTQPFLRSSNWPARRPVTFHFHSFRLENLFFVAIYFSFSPVKKAYYKLSLLVHPDRVPEGEKEIATEKFKILTKLQSILTDKDKKALYDQQGIIDDDGDSDVSWLEMWRQFFKPITTTDIDNFKREYIGECWVAKHARIDSFGCELYADFVLYFCRFGHRETWYQESISQWLGLYQLHDEFCTIYGGRRWATNRRNCKR